MNCMNLHAFGCQFCWFCMPSWILCEDVNFAWVKLSWDCWCYGCRMILTWWRLMFSLLWCYLDKKSRGIVPPSSVRAHSQKIHRWAHGQSGWPSQGLGVTCILHWQHTAGRCTFCPVQGWCSQCGVYTMSAGEHIMSYDQRSVGCTVCTTYIFSLFE